MELCLFIETVKLLSVDRELSILFSVKVGVYQGSALSPLLFIMVIIVLTEDVRGGSLMELLHTDNLVLCLESSERLWTMKNYSGLKVNVGKTKGMQLFCGRKNSVLKVGPCGVCGERVGGDYIQCTKC